MELDMPKIDLPEDMVIGTDISKEILSLYNDYPCRMKAEIFVLCMNGEIEASINLIRFHVKAFDFVTILPGSIFQIHKVEGDLKIYFMGFSSDFISQIDTINTILEIQYTAKLNPVISLTNVAAGLLEDYFTLLIKTHGHCRTQLNREITAHVLQGTLLGLGALYRYKAPEKILLAKNELISKDFSQLVMQNYNKERNVAFYAQKLGITSSHLCTTVKQVTGKTCLDIISAMVIMDAKAQLKSTNLSIQHIAYSLNFTNMSFFGKYFKRYVGMGPLEYKNS